MNRFRTRRVAAMGSVLIVGVCLASVVSSRPAGDLLGVTTIVAAVGFLMFMYTFK